MFVQVFICPRYKTKALKPSYQCSSDIVVQWTSLLNLNVFPFVGNACNRRHCKVLSLNIFFSLVFRFILYVIYSVSVPDQTENEFSNQNEIQRIYRKTFWSFVNYSCIVLIVVAFKIRMTASRCSLPKIFVKCFTFFFYSFMRSSPPFILGY